MIYSNRLKAYRMLNAVKQEEIAKLIGVAPNTYSFKENGKTPINLEEAKKIADYFNTSIDELFFAKDVRKMCT